MFFRESVSRFHLDHRRRCRASSNSFTKMEVSKRRPLDVVKLQQRSSWYTLPGRFGSTVGPAEGTDINAATPMLSGAAMSLGSMEVPCLHSCRLISSQPASLTPRRCREDPSLSDRLRRLRAAPHCRAAGHDHEGTRGDHLAGPAPPRHQNRFRSSPAPRPALAAESTRSLGSRPAGGVRCRGLQPDPGSGGLSSPVQCAFLALPLSATGEPKVIQEPRLRCGRGLVG